MRSDHGSGRSGASPRLTTLGEHERKVLEDFSIRVRYELTVVDRKAIYSLMQPTKYCAVFPVSNSKNAET